MTLDTKYNFIGSVIKHIHPHMDEDALEYFLKGLYEKRLGKNEYFIDTLKTHDEIKMLDPVLIEEKVPQFAKHLERIHSASDWKTVLSKTAAMMIHLGNQQSLTSTALANIDHQVLIGIGDQDNMVSIAESKTTVDHLQNATLQILSGCKHPIEQNDPMELAKTIHQFIHNL